MSQKRAVCFGLFVLFSNLGFSSGDPVYESKKLQGEIEVSSPRMSLSFDDLWFELLAKNKLELPVAPVLGQGNTPFCWAYAALHTARTYFEGKAREDSHAWKAFFKKMETPARYNQYLKKNSGVVAGWPSEAMLFYSQDLQLDHPWVSYVPSETEIGWKPHPGPDLHAYTPEAYFIDLNSIIQYIHDGLKDGSPAAFCTKQHCVAIYGGHYKRSEPMTYLIADSAGGKTYLADAKLVHERIADLTTLDY